MGNIATKKAPPLLREGLRKSRPTKSLAEVMAEIDGVLAEDELMRLQEAPTERMPIAKPVMMPPRPMEWRATHRAFEHGSAELVMLAADGTAPTKIEHAYKLPAAWTRDDKGYWRHWGRLVPPGSVQAVR